jgi:hypothetical protein
MKFYLTTGILTVFILCTGPATKRSPVLIPDSVEKPASGSSDTATQSRERQQVAQSLAAPPTLPPPEWVGKKFIVLPKQQLLCAQGYSLTTCRSKTCDTAAINPEWENSKHRIHCSKLSGDSVYVDNVEPDGDEWLITFSHIPTEKRIFSRTHKQAISEIAFGDDLISARKRWLHTTVFSKKGVISQLSPPPSAAITSKRIRIQDSLQVVDVRWGMTPLPVKPLWLLVRMNDTTEGFIPTRISWTNTMTDRQTERAPWDEDIYETNPAHLYQWDENMWEIINNHRVILEMTIDQVTASWGYPLEINPLPADSSAGVLWIYPSQTLQFHQNKLTAISDR